MNKHSILKTYPPLGITMGCPAGIGPEIIVKALAGRQASFRDIPFVVLGDIAVMKRACHATGMSRMEKLVKSWTPGQKIEPGTMPIMPVTQLKVEQIPYGRFSATTGSASFSYIKEGIRLCMNRELSGIVTAPVSKAGFKMAGIGFPGHTEMLAHETGTSLYAMMLAGPVLRVTLATIHCALKEVATNLEQNRILELINITHSALTRLFLIKKPSIAVAALNPHAGEGGMFGDEETRIIAPAIDQAASQGINATGPWPPDTVFNAALKGRHDAVVCMYHDQGLIPFKLVHFSDGVNITLGLPIIRTSVDHGTAYDIAGSGMAHEDSLVAAMEMAAMFIYNKKKGKDSQDLTCHVEDSAI